MYLNRLVLCEYKHFCLQNGSGGGFYMCFGNFVGKTWEKLGTFSISNQAVTNLFGNFVGITWEKLGKK